MVVNMFTIISSLLRSSSTTTIAHNLKPTLLLFLSPPLSFPFSSQPLSPPPSRHLVNNISRVLSDFRHPRHDLEPALSPFSSQITAPLVEQTLKRCKNLGFSAHRFFIWAQKLPSFTHSVVSYRILVDILGRSKQFPLVWDFLLEIKDNKSCQIGPELFWVVFGAYSRANLPLDAVRAFYRMVEFGVKPGVDDVDRLLYALCKRKHVRHASDFFDKVKAEVAPTAKTYSILMRGWGDIGEPKEARKVFDKMLERGCSLDLLAYNGLIQSFCKGGDVDEGYRLFKEMGSKGLKPDEFTFSIFINSACEGNDVRSAFRVLDRMRKFDLVPNVYTYNCIIKALCRKDEVDEAYVLLNEMVAKGARPDTWSYNTILAFHCDRNEVNRALKLISRMDQDACTPDRHTYNMVLKMLIRIGRYDRVTKTWETMEDRGFCPSASTYAVMVHGFCHKNGKLEEACKYFEMMVDEGIPPYASTCDLLRNRLIGLGFSEQTQILADKMERSTSCSIQELSKMMRGNSRPRGKAREREDSSDESEW